MAEVPAKHTPTAQRGVHQIQMAEVPGSTLTKVTFYCWIWNQRNAMCKLLYPFFNLSTLTTLNQRNAMCKLLLSLIFWHSRYHQYNVLSVERSKTAYNSLHIEYEWYNVWVSMPIFPISAILWKTQLKLCISSESNHRYHQRYHDTQDIVPFIYQSKAQLHYHHQAETSIKGVSLEKS